MSVIEVGSVRQARADEALRVLVDRLWPRGVSKERADLDAWPKDLTPSAALRTAVRSGQMPFDAFADRYREQLASDECAVALAELRRMIADCDGVTMLLVSGEASRRSHATVLREVLLHDEDEPRARERTEEGVR